LLLVLLLLLLSQTKLLLLLLLLAPGPTGSQLAHIAHRRPRSWLLLLQSWLVGLLLLLAVQLL
jgi:hypothetical protein